MKKKNIEVKKKKKLVKIINLIFIFLRRNVRFFNFIKVV